jgi:hypothetical protein
MEFISIRFSIEINTTKYICSFIRQSKTKNIIIEVYVEDYLDVLKDLLN